MGASLGARSSGVLDHPGEHHKIYSSVNVILSGIYELNVKVLHPADSAWRVV